MENLKNPTKNVIVMITIEDGSMKVVTPMLRTENTWESEKNDFINNHIICSTDKEIREAVDKIINDDCHNLITTDGDRLAEFVENEIESFTDKVKFSNENYVDNAEELFVITVTDDECVSTFEAYKVP